MDSLPGNLDSRTAEPGASSYLTAENQRTREALCLSRRLTGRPWVKCDLRSLKALSVLLLLLYAPPSISNEEIWPPFQFLFLKALHPNCKRFMVGHGSKRPSTYSGNLLAGSSDTLEGVQSWRERDQVHGRESAPGLAQEDMRSCTLALRTGHDGEASSLGRSPRGSSYGPRPLCRTAPPSAGSGSSQPAGSPRDNGEL